MPYLSRQHITLTSNARVAPTVLLAALDVVFARILTLHLERDFAVAMSDYANVMNSMRRHSPSVVIFDTASELSRITLLKDMLREFPQMPVITTSTTLDEAFLDKLMGLGVRGHVNRRFSRPQDIAALARETVFGK